MPSLAIRSQGRLIRSVKPQSELMGLRSRGFSSAAAAAEEERLDKLPMSVFYGSQSGNAQLLAVTFAQEAEQQDVTVCAGGLAASFCFLHLRWQNLVLLASQCAYSAVSLNLCMWLRGTQADFCETNLAHASCALAVADYMLLWRTGFLRPQSQHSMIRIPDIH